MSDAGSPPAAPPAEVKPKADGQSIHLDDVDAGTKLIMVDNTLNIKIVSTDGSEVFFKIKKTTKLNKLKVSTAIWRPGGICRGSNKVAMVHERWENCDPERAMLTCRPPMPTELVLRLELSGESIPCGVVQDDANRKIAI
jgi:hypothetical protein